jgi:hypothetical protein
MRLLLIALTAFAFPILGHAAIAGDWAGVIDLSGKTERFVLHVAGPDNALSATVDSWGFGLAGGKPDTITFSGSTLRFAIQYLDVSFSGDLYGNGTIVGTFVQHGTGVPLVLTRTNEPPVRARVFSRPPLPLTAGRVFHHDKTDIEVTLPSGWSVLSIESSTDDEGDMVVLTGPDHKTGASVYMARYETPQEHIPELLDSLLTRKIASRAGTTGGVMQAVISGYKIRPGSVKHTMVNGQHSLRAIGEFGGAKDPGAELLVWVSTEHARAYFDLRAQASNFETVQPAFEALIQSTRIP